MAEVLKLLGLRLGFVGNRREYLSGWKVNIFKQDEKYKGLKVEKYLILLFIVSFSQRSFKVLLLSFNCKIQQWIESATVDWVFIFRLRHLLEFWVVNWLFFPFINEWSFSGLEFYSMFFSMSKSAESIGKRAVLLYFWVGRRFVNYHAKLRINGYK